MYKALDGQQDRRNWRLALLEVLDGWKRLFPEAASNLKQEQGQAFVWVRYPRPAKRCVAGTTSQLKIVPCEAFLAVDLTGRLRAHGCGCCSFS